ncbi:MAG: ABC transporter permease [Bacteroidetes bacterium]|nr:ABC transporter permease [Bacteroidota bacterium]
MLKSYFKIGWRNILKTKGYSLINIGGLALGMAAVMLIILYVKDELAYDSFHQKAPEIYRVVTDWKRPDGSVQHQDGITGYYQGPKFKESIPEIVTAVRWMGNNRTLRINNEVSDISVYNADENFFTLFTFPFVAGNPAEALKDPNSLVITEAKALLYFNSTDVLGKTLDLKADSTFVPYKITGVVKTLPANSSIKFDFVSRLTISPQDYANSENWFNFFLTTFVELHPAASRSTVEAKMAKVYESDAAAAIKEMEEKYNVTEKAVFSLQPLKDIHLSKTYTASSGLFDASDPMYGYMLSGIAFFILLIACINFVNLSIANSLRRSKEIGVRKVVGGNKFTLAIQFLSESFVICFFAFVAAVFLVQLSLPLFNTLAQKSISILSLFDGRMLLAYAGLFVATGLFAGFYPSLVLSGFNPVKTLYGRFRFSGKQYTLRALVVLQFALASFLIMATLTIYSQFNFLTTKDLGYDDKNLVVVNKSNLTRDQFSIFQQMLAGHSGIIGIAPKNGGEWNTVAKVSGEKMIKFQYNIVDESYLPLLKIPVVRGRNFSSDFTADGPSSVLVNEAFVKQAGWDDPIGQKVNFWYRNAEYTVVGVVKNHNYNALNYEIQPQLFTKKPDENFGCALIKLSGQDTQASLALIEKTFKSAFPDYAYTYEFVSENNRRHYEQEARWNKIVMSAAAITIFISCIGLLGLAALAAERRNKEIGVRKVLGASAFSITKGLSVGFLQMVILSFVIAVPAAAMVSSQWLKGYAYRVEFSVWTVVITVMVTTSIALITVCSQGIRAALANPVKSLRSE